MAAALPQNDRFATVGAAAEHQMAFYLRWASADDPAVLALNDLRVPAAPRSADFAQIDHLLIHR